MLITISTHSEALHAAPTPSEAPHASPASPTQSRAIVRCGARGNNAPREAHKAPAALLLTGNVIARFFQVATEYLYIPAPHTRATNADICFKQMKNTFILVRYSELL